ncbi:transposase domain-containing protein [Mesorhizobium sp. M0213]|uniref:transposase domain-containing protein n=1 Tax=Mesorhizobium sp. M0213 TaxID=2956917 RepID=UPI0033373758
MNQVDPHAWLTLTLERVANGWPKQRYRRPRAMELPALNGLSCPLTLLRPAVKMIHFDALMVCSINHTETKNYLASAKRVGIGAESCYALMSTLVLGWASGNVGQKD